MFKNNIDALMGLNTPDIVEETDWGFYLGFFRPGTDNTMTENCMIIEMRTVGSITTRKFAEGENTLYRLTWNNRTEYSYKFRLKAN